MIEQGSKTWFLSRPNGFGKSLIVSTLKSIFSGKRELFDGLSILKNLDKPLFAPRPVIHLDMSALTMRWGAEGLEKNLSKKISDTATSLGVRVSEYLNPSMALSSIITLCHKKYGCRVAILIDDYDAPLEKFYNSPYRERMIRFTLRKFYTQLESEYEHISFLFVTGLTKLNIGGMDSTFRDVIDISLDPKYGALAGFTYDEIMNCFPVEIRKAAESQKMSEEDLLSKLEEYYGGFCFDGQTFVYNPNSILHFFKDKEFTNFWYGSCTPKHFSKFLRNHRITIEKFRRKKASKIDIESTNTDKHIYTEAYLFQLGFLALRPYSSKEEYLLDYPNLETSESLARFILQSYYGSPKHADILQESVVKALFERNHLAFIKALGELLKVIPLQFYLFKQYLMSKEQTRKEDIYCMLILIVFYDLRIKFHAEKHGQFGSHDFVVNAGKETWVIKVSVSSYDERRLKNAENDKLLAEIDLEEMAEAILNDDLKGLKKSAVPLKDTEKMEAMRDKAKKLAQRFLAGQVHFETIGLEAMSTFIGISLDNLKLKPMEKERPEEAILDEDERLLHIMRTKDQELADAIFEDSFNFGTQYDNPVLLAFVINDNLNVVTAFKGSG
jgi:hypothetical protein